MKVHRLDEGYTWIPKRRDFVEDPNEVILGNQIFRVREASYPCYYTQIGRDSSYLDLFLLLWTDFYLRGCLDGFSTLRGCLAPIYALRDCLSYF